MSDASSHLFADTLFLLSSPFTFISFILFYFLLFYFIQYIEVQYCETLLYQVVVAADEYCHVYSNSTCRYWQLEQNIFECQQIPRVPEAGDQLNK